MSAFLHGMSWLTLVVLPVILLLYMQVRSCRSRRHDDVDQSHGLLADIGMLLLIGVFLTRAETSFFQAFWRSSLEHPLTFLGTTILLAVVALLLVLRRDHSGRAARPHGRAARLVGRAAAGARRRLRLAARRRRPRPSASRCRSPLPAPTARCSGFSIATWSRPTSTCHRHATARAATRRRRCATAICATPSSIAPISVAPI